jgi:hypothetical protein
MKATFANTDNALWPGLSVATRVLVETLKQVVVVPDDAVRRGPNGLYVFAVSDSSDPEFRSSYRWSVGAQTWEDLLQRRRVVILAEAGSGKTEEMKEHARCRTEAREFAFYATVQDVGHRGLSDALRPADRARFNAWLGADRIGWFFIDSVDEAKLDVGHDRLPYNSR